ncbi:hypothetical protein VP01_2216g2 [Puccinia sorghi]|uniref:Uncharacterized protein n=1 Tax=Puccinia sorghi TaxID=27349 RepID=A0A0L6V904_9BASI|nr:hypothetical protein VP01_2216g2 [Puccinia sorghi]
MGSPNEEGGSRKDWPSQPKHDMAPSQVLSAQSLLHHPLFEEAYNQIQSYQFLHSGLNLVLYPLNEYSIIFIIKFTSFDKLTPSEKDELNFISTFLHNSKLFINKVSSCSLACGGLVQAIV